MTIQTVPDPRPTAAEGHAAPRRVLVVDDSRAQRRILAAALGRWGYLVDEAGTGLEALARLGAQPYDFVLSDWMMPGLDGLGLCRAFRALPNEGYGYFILLTAKNAREEVAHGLAVGADDFIAKPVNLAELQARMLAGDRILTMERELTAKNRLVSATLEEMSGLYAALDRDLVEARKLQMTLVRERQRDFGLASVAVMLRPSGHVGGDLVGYFQPAPGRLVFYAIDVSGHGVASAIMAARLAGMLASASPEGNLALAFRHCGAAESRPPEAVAARLNRIVLESMQVDQYFTCVYAEAELGTGRVALVQAGHPHPLILRADGRTEPVGAGGLPIGLVPDAAYERVELTLGPGDRLVLMSDGLTEATDPAGRELGEEGASAFVAKNRSLAGHRFLEALVWDVEGFLGAAEFTDDISAVVYEYRGAASE